jgi:hypothetical protein
MKNTAVNLGAGGFVSYFDDGGASVILGPDLQNNQDGSEEPDYNEQGVGAFLADQFRSIVSDEEKASANEIRTSGRYNSKNRDVYYPEGGPTFFETLATEYGYPDNINPLAGSNRMDVPRDDLPKAQELEDTRAHMLASALIASEYGPKTAESVGNLKEFTDSPFTSLLGDSSHTIMDKRNNAVGISLFRKAGINATEAQLTEAVDDRIFAQLNVILARAPDEQEENFRSPKKGPDVYFPREKSGRFSPDPLY